MKTLVNKIDSVAVGVTFKGDQLTVKLAEGGSVSVPLEAYPRLLHGTDKERRNWQLLDDGDVIEWLDLDAHIGVEGLVAGRYSSESKRSLDHWLEERRALHAGS
jgi:hypothetical protein